MQQQLHQQEQPLGKGMDMLGPLRKGMNREFFFNFWTLGKEEAICGPLRKGLISSKDCLPPVLRPLGKGDLFVNPW